MLAEVDELVARVQIELAQVRAFDETGQQDDELFALHLRSFEPMTAEGAARDLAKINSGLDDVLDRGPPVGATRGFFEGGVVEDPEDLVDFIAELIIGGAGPSYGHAYAREHGHEHEAAEGATHAGSIGRWLSFRRP